MLAIKVHAIVGGTPAYRREFVRDDTPAGTDDFDDWVIGRKSGDLAHPLNVLIDSGLVHRRPDAFRENHTTYGIAEPLITFYHAVMRPIWSDLAHTRNPVRLWERSQPRFTANVLGPHFEQLCRHWTRYFASEEVTGGFPARVEPGTVNDPGSKKTRQVDVAGFGFSDDARETILSSGRRGGTRPWG